MCRSGINAHFDAQQPRLTYADRISDTIVALETHVQDGVAHALNVGQFDVVAAVPASPGAPQRFLRMTITEEEPEVVNLERLIDGRRGHPDLGLQAIVERVVERLLKDGYITLPTEAEADDPVQVKPEPAVPLPEVGAIYLWQGGRCPPITVTARVHGVEIYGKYGGASVYFVQSDSPNTIRHLDLPSFWSGVLNTSPDEAVAFARAQFGGTQEPSQDRESEDYRRGYADGRRDGEAARSKQAKT